MADDTPDIAAAQRMADTARETAIMVQVHNRHLANILVSAADVIEAQCDLIKFMWDAKSH